MDRTFILDKTFSKLDFATNPIAKADYEGCTFTGCNFSDTDLSGINFSECEFASCNLSMAKLNDTSFKDVRFKDCKMLGLHFENCNNIMFSAEFKNCTLNLSSFFKLKLKSTQFENCSLQEVDFGQANLNAAKFESCDLLGAIFENTNLEKADFRTAYGYSIDPEINQIKKAKFSVLGIAGLLRKYDIEIE